MAFELGQVLYRYGAHVHFISGIDTSTVYIVCEKWHVGKLTPKGAWVYPYPNPNVDYGERHLVIEGTRRAWAYVTKEDAWNSFQIRCRWRRSYWATEGRRLDAIEKAIADQDAPPENEVRHAFT